MRRTRRTRDRARNAPARPSAAVPDSEDEAYRPTPSARSSPSSARKPHRELFSSRSFLLSDSLREGIEHSVVAHSLRRLLLRLDDARPTRAPPLRLRLGLRL